MDSPLEPCLRDWVGSKTASFFATVAPPIASEKNRKLLASSPSASARLPCPPGGRLVEIQSRNKPRRADRRCHFSSIAGARPNRSAAEESTTMFPAPYADRNGASTPSRAPTRLRHRCPIAPPSLPP